MPVILLTSVGTSREGYLGRIVVGEHDVTLKRATGADEGSYTVRDAEGKIQTRLCLNVLSERMTPSISHSDGLFKEPKYSCVLAGEHIFSV